MNLTRWTRTLATLAALGCLWPGAGWGQELRPLFDEPLRKPSRAAISDFVAQGITWGGEGGTEYTLASDGTLSCPPEGDARGRVQREHPGRRVSRQHRRAV